MHGNGVVTKNLRHFKSVLSSGHYITHTYLSYIDNIGRLCILESYKCLTLQESENRETLSSISMARWARPHKLLFVEEPVPPRIRDPQNFNVICRKLVGGTRSKKPVIPRSTIDCFKKWIFIEICLAQLCKPLGLTKDLTSTA